MDTVQDPGRPRSGGMASQPEVRQLLARFLGRPLQPDDIVREASGRPGLARVSEPFDFNLSHTDRWLAVVASRTHRVGVDLEQCNRRLSPPLQAWLGWPGQTQLALLAWTLNEAFVKAIGCGLRERHIGGVAQSLNEARCPPRDGFSCHSLLTGRRWSLLTVQREPLQLSVAIRHGSSPVPRSIHLCWNARS